jgi:hypothetical protein
MPPVRQLMRCGLTLEKSKAGEIQLATMLMPTVARTNTGTVAEAVITVSSEKNRKSHRPGERAADQGEHRVVAGVQAGPVRVRQVVDATADEHVGVRAADEVVADVGLLDVDIGGGGRDRVPFGTRDLFHGELSCG